VVYWRTREQIGGHPFFASVAGRHLFRHPKLDKWHLRSTPYNPASPSCAAWILASGGPVPTGARARRLPWPSFGTARRGR
jgi:hypothetical protein